MLVLPVLLASINRLESIKLERNMATVIKVAPVLMRSVDMINVSMVAATSMESLVENATSENLTAEDWTLIIGICEQVEGYVIFFSNWQINRTLIGY
jgi:hypothetical protein